VELDPQEARHAKARRIKPGDRLILLDGAGGEAEGVLLGGSAPLRVRVERLSSPRVESPAPIVLVAPALRSGRLSWMLEKATELGVSKIVLANSARTQAERLQLAANRGLERLRRVCREAAKQCGRSVYPELVAGASFESVLTLDCELRLLLDPSGKSFPIVAPASAALWIGPEGGFTNEERSRAAAAGWEPVRLPAATLRAETAAISAVALLRQSFDTAASRAQN
jgi:16S rRNA (uracil1498-N3)-methyltransferase